MIRSLDSLRAFLSVAQHTSFAKAATQLNLSSSSVSRHVAELEKELGVTLLTRSTRNVALTAAGKILFEQASQIVSSLDELGDNLKESSEYICGDVSISAPWWFSAEFLPNALAELHQQYPEVIINLHSDDKLLDPNEGQYDIYLRFGRIQDSGLIAKEIVKNEYWLLAAPNYLKEFGLPLTPQDLQAHQVFAFRFTQSHSSWFFKQNKKQFRFNLQHAWLKTNNPAVIYHNTLIGSGIALLPALSVSNDVQQGTLVRLLADYQITPNRLENHLFLIYSKDKVRIKRVKCVIDFLAKSLKQYLHTFT
ncbi:LysR family transcriptional regulator [Zooshikella harenae]|uniref:LysR family transcriptional regulator n=1 Tax=Zooshikella harenae TaxID=2827238 RepID=A0ABS5ZET7_9GAMM|nr:LysR family transcriptional regulator [Zooshikella harenae]MBU2712577.1 LysR family transcriptional regulator [Zooshikella harenae]